MLSPSRSTASNRFTPSSRFFVLAVAFFVVILERNLLLRMRHSLQLTALLLTFTGAASLRAQISDPNALVAPPPHKHDVPHRPTNSNPQWIWEYTRPLPNGRADQLRFDERFGTLLDDNFRQVQAMWDSEPGKNVPLADIIPRFVAKYSTVTTTGNRYISVDGCVPTFCAAHGMLWLDLGSKQPLMVFAAVNWSTEGHTTEEAAANYYLWLFPNRYLSSDALPFALTQSIAHWDVRLAASHRLVPHISHAILVEPDGTPVELQPALAGANTIAPQPDTLTPRTPDD